MVESGALWREWDSMTAGDFVGACMSRDEHKESYNRLSVRQCPTRPPPPPFQQFRRQFPSLSTLVRLQAYNRPKSAPSNPRIVDRNCSSIASMPMSRTSGKGVGSSPTSRVERRYCPAGWSPHPLRPSPSRPRSSPPPFSPLLVAQHRGLSGQAAQGWVVKRTQIRAQGTCRDVSTCPAWQAEPHESRAQRPHARPGPSWRSTPDSVLRRSFARRPCPPRC